MVEAEHRLPADKIAHRRHIVDAEFEQVLHEEAVGLKREQLRSELRVDGLVEVDLIALRALPF